ncbi:hypothetical protein KC19_1G293800 [Ceratodon purpureus]|uniref:EGF-like calcium-binding domain-containing protein n=1 Tax=Ceratodon purpureus TaxID=3225 RepID=A0A8T0JD42_CERPU|nr:hypothetical protein KC19_1G293800 [Ceratodon purpureus]
MRQHCRCCFRSHFPLPEFAFSHLAALRLIQAPVELPTSAALWCQMEIRRTVPIAILGILLEFCLVVSTWGKFFVETNSLTVTSPASLKGSHDSAIGNFGVPQYGGTMAGTVVYPAKQADGCTPFTESLKGPNTGGRPVFALLDRGGCYFALKAWNAQNAGAAAVLVADDKVELLITMDTPDEGKYSDLTQNITIPSALIDKHFGDDLKRVIAANEMVNINLDWRESLPHPDERVEYEFWTNSNDICGPKCDAQAEFKSNFKGVAQLLEKGGYTSFIPHYITWYCPQAFIESKQCKSQCINKGRYCAPDPEQDFNKGYEGKDVVLENLRQLCVFNVARDAKRPWVWWDYVTDFQIRCPMKDKLYNRECAEKVMTSLSLSVADVRSCMMDPELDADNDLLKKEQDAQVGTGTRGDVTILPTLIINSRQYRGKLDKGAVMKAICSGFQETTDPPVCLSEGVETNECLENNGGCWANKNANITACKDTFRGRVCQCPLVNGVQFQGDGYTTCEATGVGRCKVDNAGCWQEKRGNVAFSACQDFHPKGCQCPEGFRGDGIKECIDIDECRERSKCQCPECKCTNQWGGYDCECSNDLLYIHEHDTCISKKSQQSKIGWVVFLIVLVAVATLAVGGYVVYKYRLRSYMDSEIRAIMAQYMPLDSSSDINHHLNEEP